MDTRVFRIEGLEGTAMIRYAEPSENNTEYKMNCYRFKITPTKVKNAKIFLFCLVTDCRISYYIFPSQELANIQSLNLKFDKYEKSKYAPFLEKVVTF